MDENTEIRRLPGGSIDLEHYARIGRALHGAAVRGAVRHMATLPYRLAARLAAAIVRRRHGAAPGDPIHAR